MMYFGFFEGLPYKSATESFDSYRRMKNNIPKEKVIAHIETLDVWATSKSINDILDDLNDLISTIGFNEKLGCLNNAGNELQRLFDELFPLGEDVWI